MDCSNGCGFRYWCPLDYVQARRCSGSYCKTLLTISVFLHSEPLVSNIMWRNLLIQEIYQVSVLLILNFQGVKLLGLRNEPNRPAIKVKNSMIFNAFVFCQWAAEHERRLDVVPVFGLQVFGAVLALLEQPKILNGIGKVLHDALFSYVEVEFKCFFSVLRCKNL
ncbi:calcium-transporting ATPase 5, plasma membrane-type isoform X2 [Vigna radiata var. radiata]|uniref:Calcium-transporting ATPase 5, plasma membrane-type isoform X2 n=1 Tax=Vigna radiata var. radiata TaxID=3916 RepID=A0A1S3ULM3_VIGRR|nr:calcium-transporting ATPase 5, plasma membrane-type isoform X2 [Vigna radiata var. radiata]XP_022638880.1 calcium-transporting ATPase 5, plasma membrane-type isoform X2 [Vigna radiata var. radiata]